MWRERVNDALGRVTGYELRRREPDRPTPAPYPTPEAAPEQPQGTPAQRPVGGSGGRQGKLPPHYDTEAKKIIHAVRPRTKSAHQKLYGLILAARYVAANDIPGDVVACGVWRGGSVQAVALALLGAGASDRELHLFDPFEPGSAEPGDETYMPFDDVRTAMAETAYPPEHIHYHKGQVEETIPALAPERIAVLRLDTDWYESTRHELEHLYERLVPGGVLIVDDYGGGEGSRLATEEFVEKTGAPLLLVPLKTGRIAVKPAF